MALNSSGPLSFGGATTGQSINLELGVSATALASINSTSFRTLAGVASGQISISNFYGKSNTPTYWSSLLSSVFPTSLDLAANATTVAVGGYDSVSGVGACYQSYNANTGALNWVFRDSSFDRNSKSAFDSAGNVYFFSYFSSPGRLVKFNTSGVVQWARSVAVVGGNGGYGAYLAVDSADNVYCGGGGNSGSSFYAGLSKFDSSGTQIYKRFLDNASGSNGFWPQGITTDSSNNVYVSAWDRTGSNTPYLAKISSAGAFVSAFSFTATSVFPSNTFVVTQDPQIDSSGNIYLAGYGGTGVYRAWVAKFNSSYVLQWARYLTSPATSVFPRRLMVDSAGTVTLSASYANQDGSVFGVYFTLNTSGTSTGAYSFTNLQGNSIFAIGKSSTDILYINQANTSTGPNSYTFKLPADGTGTGYYLPGGSGTPVYYTSINATWTSFTPVVTTGSNINMTAAGTDSSITVTSSGTAPTTTASIITTIGGSSGSAAYLIADTTYTWIVPTGVTSISAVTVGGGAGGYAGYPGGAGAGGGGGGLAYLNNFATTAGTSFTVYVGQGGSGAPPNGSPGTADPSYIQSSGVNRCRASGANTSSGGGFVAGTAGSTGGGGNGGGGGAAGYAGTGGIGGSINVAGTAGNGGGGGGGGGGNTSGGNATGGYKGGGVGLGGQGSNGTAGTINSSGNAGSSGSSSTFGGGGNGGGSYYVVCCCGYWDIAAGSPGTRGGVRIVWPGSTRTFPSTNVGSP
jgi:hypothetical protein